jgi:putative phosphoesterase
VRIGLIADTHMPGSIRALWPQIPDAFASVDCILHAGDLHTGDVIDQLESIAPTYVARGNGDVGVEDHRIQDTWVLELGGVTIAMVHRFPTPKRKPNEFIAAYAERTFPGVNPDVVIYGHTHRDEIHQVDDLLCVNPGSPTLPRNLDVRLGTIGVLQLAEGRASAELFQLTASGFVPVLSNGREVG